MNDIGKISEDMGENSDLDLDIFSPNSSPIMNSTYYNLNPSITIDSDTIEEKDDEEDNPEHQGGNVNFSFNNSFIDDNYSSGALSLGGINYNSHPPPTRINEEERIIIKNIELQDECLKYLNIYINLYNDNIQLYRQSADILEEYFDFLFNKIKTCFMENLKILTQIKCKDIERHIFRNYNPLLEYITSIYQLQEMYIYDKINEIEKYMLTVEKIFLKQSHLLKRGIWFYQTLIILPINDDINFYTNYPMKEVFQNIRKTFQDHFNYIFHIISY